MKCVAIKAIDAFVVPVSAKTKWILIEIRTDDGVPGYGEATFAGAEEAVLAEIAHARALVVGKPLGMPGETVAALHMASMAEARRIVVAALERRVWTILPAAPACRSPRSSVVRRAAKCRSMQISIAGSPIVRRQVLPHVREPWSTRMATRR